VQEVNMRFTLCTVGSWGDVSPFLSLGRALVERGSEVILAETFWRNWHPHDPSSGPRNAENPAFGRVFSSNFETMVGDTGFEPVTSAV
jgi:hypothetical protein